MAHGDFALTDSATLPERTNALSQNPDTLDAVLGLVAEGKHTLLDIAKLFNVPRADVQEWLLSSEENKARYDRAVAIGEVARRERVLCELENIAFLDIKDCFKDGMVLPLEQLPEHARRAVQRIKQYSATGKAINLSVEFYDRLKALELLGKAQRMFVDRTEVELKNPYQAVPVKVTERLQDPEAINGEFERLES